MTLVPPAARPCRTSADLSWDHSSSVFIFIGGCLIPHSFSGLQLSSWGGGWHRTGSWEQPKHGLRFRSAGPRVDRCPHTGGGPNTLLHSCSVQMVKRNIDASTWPSDELSVDIPEVVKKTFCPPNFTRGVWDRRLESWNRDCKKNCLFILVFLDYLLQHHCVFVLTLNNNRECFNWQLLDLSRRLETEYHA